MRVDQYRLDHALAGHIRAISDAVEMICQRDRARSAMDLRRAALCRPRFSRASSRPLPRRARQAPAPATLRAQQWHVLVPINQILQGGKRWHAEVGRHKVHAGQSLKTTYISPSSTITPRQQPANPGAPKLRISLTISRSSASLCSLAPQKSAPRRNARLAQKSSQFARFRPQHQAHRHTHAAAAAPAITRAPSVCCSHSARTRRHRPRTTRGRNIGRPGVHRWPAAWPASAPSHGHLGEAHCRLRSIGCPAAGLPRERKDRPSPRGEMQRRKLAPCVAVDPGVVLRPRVGRAQGLPRRAPVPLRADHNIEQRPARSIGSARRRPRAGPPRSITWVAVSHMESPPDGCMHDRAIPAAAFCGRLTVEYRRQCQRKLTHRAAILTARRRSRIAPLIVPQPFHEL